MDRTVLIVDEKDLVRWSLGERLALEGYATRQVATVASAIEHLIEPVDAVLLDDQLPDGDGIAPLDRIRSASPETSIVVMTVHWSVEHAVEMMKHGAFACVMKPSHIDYLSQTIRSAVDVGRLRREVRRLRGADGDLTQGDRRSDASNAFTLPFGGIDLADVERQLLGQAIDRADGNLSEAGRLLGLNRDQVRYRMKRFRLNKPARPGGARRSERVIEYRFRRP